ncbi:MAG: DUF1080 domain-containing protein [Opitutaceae bacterium]
MKTRLLILLASVSVALASTVCAADRGFVSLFNGRDLTGWKTPVGDNGHWKVLNGVIDYDARSEAAVDKNLWSEKEYKDFTLRIDWRIKETTGLYNMPTVLPDGSHKRGPDGKDIITPTPNADSGIYLRGSSKAQLNIWCWPIGSGEVYGYRMDQKMPPAVRAGVTPKVRADKPVGEWNTFEITMKGDRLTVVLNGKTVIENAQLPDVPATGALALQHHGGFTNGKYNAASSLVQFRNISIKEL